MPKEVLNSIMENFDLPGDYSHLERINLLGDEKDIHSKF